MRSLFTTLLSLGRVIALLDEVNSSVRAVLAGVVLSQVISLSRPSKAPNYSLFLVWDPALVIYGRGGQGSRRWFRMSAHEVFGLLRGVKPRFSVALYGDKGKYQRILHPPVGGISDFSKCLGTIFIQGAPKDALLTELALALIVILII